MNPGSSDEAILAELEHARLEGEQPLTREEIGAILTEVVLSMEGDISAVDLRICRELEALSQFIQAARNEIAAIRPDEIREDFIPTATDELDAVVGATEEATGVILDSAEKIMTLAMEQDDPLQSGLTEPVMRIFEACNFQDITGQRITKVVSALHHIEDKIAALLGIVGESVERRREAAVVEPEEPTGPAEPASDEDLLNGPQLPGSGIGQDEIDKLLASFD